MSLGPQCWSCRRRRVKCDSGIPGCKKCEMKGVQCDGYSNKPLVWVNAAKSTRGENLRMVFQKMNSRPDGPRTSRELVWKRPEPLADFDQLVFHTDVDLNIRSIEYYNRYICPTFVAVDSVHNPYRVNPSTWHRIPHALLDLTVSVVATHQDVSRRPLPWSVGHVEGRNELEVVIHKHRGSVLKQLNRAIAFPKSQMQEITLICIVSLLLAEIQQSAYGAWKMHLEGARSIIESFGGLETLLKRGFPPLNRFLSYFVLIDIFGSTTSALTLEVPRSTQSCYIQLLPRIFGNGLSSCVPCANELLSAVIHTNELRQSLSSFNPGPSANILYDSALSLLARLIRFSPSKWAAHASKLSTDGKVTEIPTICCLDNAALDCSPSDWHSEEAKDVPEAWLDLAVVYHSAVLLYLIHSVVLQIVPADTLIGIASEETIEDVRTARTADLRWHLRRIFNSKRSGPSFEHAVFWPLVVAALETDPMDDEFKIFIRKTFQRMALQIGSQSPLDAIRFLDAYWDRERWKLFRSTWDEIFGDLKEPAIFIM